MIYKKIHKNFLLDLPNINPENLKVAYKLKDGILATFIFFICFQEKQHYQSHCCYASTHYKGSLETENFPDKTKYQRGRQSRKPYCKVIKSISCTQVLFWNHVANKSLLHSFGKTKKQPIKYKQNPDHIWNISKSKTKICKEIYYPSADNHSFSS